MLDLGAKLSRPAAEQHMNCLRTTGFSAASHQFSSLHHRAAASPKLLSCCAMEQMPALRFTCLAQCLPLCGHPAVSSLESPPKVIPPVLLCSGLAASGACVCWTAAGAGSCSCESGPSRALQQRKLGGWVP